MGRFRPAVGEPGYLPYCGCCSGLIRCVRDADGFRCPITGKKGRTVNGRDMFDETAPDGPGYDWSKQARLASEEPTTPVCNVFSRQLAKGD